MAPERKTRTFILAGFATALFAMIIVGLFAARSAALFTESAAKAQTSQHALAKLQEVLRLVTRAESDLRGYVITGSTEYLDLYGSAPKRTQEELAVLKGIRPDPKFQEEVAAVGKAARERLTQLENVRQAYERSGQGEAVRMIKAGTGLSLMKELRTKVGEMEKAEEALLTKQSEETEARKAESKLFLPIGILVSVLALIIATRMVLRDSDRRIAAEQETKRVSNTQRAILDSTTLAVISTDASGKVNLMNKAAEAMLGYAAYDVVGKKGPEIFLDPSEVKSRAKELGVAPGMEVFTKPALEHGVYEEDWTYVRKDGTKFPVQLSITPVKSDGNVLGFVAIASDLSERRSIMRQLDSYVADLEKTKESLAEKNRLLEEAAEELLSSRDEAVAATNTKSEFLANMSHEIRTPLNGVLGTTHLLLGTELNDKQRSYVQLIHRSAESLLSILNDILDLSKMEAGKMTLEEAPFDLLETAEDVCEQFAPVAHQKGIELNLAIQPKAPTLLVGDSVRIRQVLTNLVANAIKFTEKGQVLVHIEILKENKKDVRARVRVKDTGIGIPQDKLDAIFESFTQADGATARRFGGTGLGLAISKQLVELMHGEIGVGSKPGQGSEFWFEVSLAKQAEHATPMRDLGGINVLVVDDNETNRLVLRGLLESWNCKVREAPSGQEAKEKLLQGGFDAAIIDQQMPEMDGPSLARELKKSRATQDLPLILVSSSHLLPTETDSKGLFHSSLSKPVRSNLLYESLIKAVRGVSAPQTDSQQKSTASLAGVRILVVEDNPINQLVVTEMLKSWGVSVVAVDNGKKAVDRTLVDAFDMVLMDVQMPEMDGLEATMAIRKREQQSGRHIPIVAMTANAMKGDEEKCIQSGMDSYMCKPVQPKLLVEKISNAVGRPVKLEDLARPVASEENLPVFDPSQLEQTTAGRDDLQVQVLERYLKNIEPQIERLRVAIKDGNPDQIKSLAHSLKGSSWTVGAVAIADLFRKVESGAHSMSEDGLMRILDQTDGAMAAVRERIEGHMMKLAGSSR
ncbi:MAG TPA: response regulator [Fimbriimonas sp.]|nr:response regulator [Fimbriimonas sp.]